MLRAAGVMRKKFLLMFLLVFAPTIGATESTREVDVAVFTVRPKVDVTVAATQGSIKYTIESEIGRSMNQFSLDSERTPKISIDDFNFDGYKDFSASYLDEGMGAYTIHRVFIFQPDSSRFLEARPGCNEEFLNLVIDRRKRILISTYYADHEAKLCYTRLRKTD